MVLRFFSYVAVVVLLTPALTLGESYHRVIEDLRAQGEQKGWTFEVGETWAVKQPLESITGLKKPDNWEEVATYKTPQVSSRALPFMWDWTKVLERSTVPPIKNQGNCGSCWAFGTVAAMEFSYSINQKSRKLFSEQELVSCSREGSCNGGWFAHGYHVSPGAALSQDYPYQGRDTACRKDISQEDRIFKYYFLGNRDRSPSVKEIKRAIYEHGALSVTVTANNAMQAYKGGLFNGCSSGQVNHMVALVGWGHMWVNDQLKEYWIMRNSWGTNWGEDGYMKIPFGCSRIAEHASYVVYQGDKK